MNLANLLTLQAISVALVARQAKRELASAVLLAETDLREQAQKNRPARERRAAQSWKSSMGNYSITPAQFWQRYRVELTRTSCAPTWWEYQVIDNATGALIVSGEIQGARRLAAIEGEREVRRLEGVRQPFRIMPITNGYNIPC